MGITYQRKFCMPFINEESLFPANYSRDIVLSHEFEIQDDILYKCLAHFGYPSKDIEGGAAKKSTGMALMSYFVSTALDFRRLPYCEDRIYASDKHMSEFKADYKEANLKRILQELTQERIDKICAEVLSLYEHTQEHFAKANLGYSTITLTRNITESDSEIFVQGNLVETLLNLKASADLLGIDFVEVEMDTINSFSGANNSYNFRPGVLLELDIPISDILFCRNLLHARGAHTEFESNEWLVINRSPNGIVQIPVKSIKPNEGAWEMTRQITEKSARDYMDNYNPVFIRTMPERHNSYNPNVGGFRQSKLSQIYTYLVKKIQLA